MFVIDVSQAKIISQLMPLRRKEALEDACDIFVDSSQGLVSSSFNLVLCSESSFVPRKLYSTPGSLFR